MDRSDRQQLAWLERRCRMLTGIILAALALAAGYGWLFFSGQANLDGRQHFYAWLVAALFYFAGDLLAFIWFRVVTVRLELMLAQLRRELQRQAGALEEEEETLEPPDVEYVRPAEHKG